MMDFERISIFYLSSDGGDWALYLQSKLNTKEYSIDTVLNDLVCDRSLHRTSAKLNLFLITPDFLDRHNLKEFFSGFQKKNSLLILTGTESIDIETHAARDDCSHVLHWLVHEMHGDEESVRELMLTIVGVYEGHINRHVSESDDAELYDILPKSRQVNKVKDIIQKDDTVYVMLERFPEESIVVQFPLDEVKPEFLSKIAVFSFDCSDMDTAEFKVLQDGSKIGEGRLLESEEKVFENVNKCFNTVETQTDDLDDSIDGSSTCTDSIYDNPRLHSFSSVESSPEKCNTKSKLDKIKELLEDETDPERLLCQCLGIDERDLRKLDEKMSSMVENTETFKHLSVRSSYSSEETSRDSTWPSLLHFGAEYNLVKFCDVLLSNPLMYSCCTLANKDGLLPHQLAQKCGHTQLAEMLKHFMQFVQTGTEGKYDSGFPPDTPRLSTISQHMDTEGIYVAPPTPHKAGYVGYYLNESNVGENEEGIVEEEDYINESELKKVRQQINSDQKRNPKLPNRSFSDSSYDSTGNSWSNDVFSIPEEERLPSIEDPFAGMLDISKLPTYDAKSLSKSTTDPILHTQMSSDPDHKRKDIMSHLGIEQTSPTGSDILSSSPSEQKKNRILNLFRTNKKTRSRSEPCFPKDEFAEHMRKKKETRYKKTSPESRSSGASSSSTTSTISGDGLDDSQVDLRHSGKGKKMLKQILVSKKRKSIRIKHVMDDVNLAAPKLPPRRPYQSESETF